MTVKEIIDMTCLEVIEVWATCDETGEHSLVFCYNDVDTKIPNPDFPKEILSREVIGIGTDNSTLDISIKGDMEMFDRYKEHPAVIVPIWLGEVRND